MIKARQFMTIYKRNAISLFGAFGITAMLFLLLVLVDSILYSPLEEPARRGSIKLSQHTKAPTQEESKESEEVPEVAELENLEKIEINLETPSVQPAMPNMNFDFAPQIAGTVSISAIPVVGAVNSPQATLGGAFSLGDVDELPRPIYAPPPAYPSKVTGRTKTTVRVRMLLGVNGEVRQISPINMTEEQKPFVDEILKSVSTWEFTPCKKGGQAVQCIAEQPFVFTPR